MRQSVLIVCVLALLVCVKCSKDASQGDRSRVLTLNGAFTTPRVSESNKADSMVADIIAGNMLYYKSASTGLCYAVSKSATGGSYSDYSHTCVPCDSLRRVHVYLVK